MNANDMNFRQKDLKTIFNKKPDKDIRRNIFESASVKEVMNIAEFGNQKIDLWQKQIMMNYLCVQCIKYH